MQSTDPVKDDCLNFGHTKLFNSNFFNKISKNYEIKHNINELMINLIDILAAKW